MDEFSDFGDSNFADPGPDAGGSFSDAPSSVYDPGPEGGGNFSGSPAEGGQYVIEGDKLVTQYTGQPSPLPDYVYTSANTITPPSEQTATGTPGFPNWLGSFISDLGGAISKGAIKAAPDIVNKVLRRVTGTEQPASTGFTSLLGGSNSMATLLLLGGGLFFLSRK